MRTADDLVDIVGALKGYSESYAEHAIEYAKLSKLAPCELITFTGRIFSGKLLIPADNKMFHNLAAELMAAGTYDFIFSIHTGLDNYVPRVLPKGTLPSTGNVCPSELGQTATYLSIGVRKCVAVNQLKVFASRDSLFEVQFKAVVLAAHELVPGRDRLHPVFSLVDSIKNVTDVCAAAFEAASSSYGVDKLGNDRLEQYGSSKISDEDIRNFIDKERS